VLLLFIDTSRVQRATLEVLQVDTACNPRIEFENKCRAAEPILIGEQRRSCNFQKAILEVRAVYIK
jgi:hypothetical protein